MAQQQPVVALLGAIYHADAEKLLRSHARVLSLPDPTPAEVRDALAQAHGAVVRYPIQVNPAVLADARRLAVVASSGRGTDSIDVRACTERGIAVVNNPGLGTGPVSEHAVAMMLALSRRLFECARTVRESDAWQRRAVLDVRDVSGRTLGIVGLGLIGSEMARKCIAAFGMNVLAYDPHVGGDRARELGVKKVDRLEDLLRASDVVTLHCELNDETRGMIGEEQLRAMKPSALLVNTSRGKVVQQQALVRALAEGWISGAALDVYEDEPLAAGSPVFDLQNLLLTPHIAGLSNDALHQLAHSAVNQLLQGLRGERPPHVVNPSAWDAARERLARELG